MLKINIWKNQKEIEKTFAVDAYDLMYGTVEDIFEILDGVDALEKKDDAALISLIQTNRGKINDLLMDVFPDLTPEDLRKIKLKELIPFFVDLFSYVRVSFHNSKN